MQTPLDPLVAGMVTHLADNLREDFEERAAIVEHEAHVPRAHAECLALLDVLHRHPDVLTGVTVLRVERGGAICHLLTTDLPVVRRNLLAADCTVLCIRDLADVVRKQHEGVALLASFT
jgi:hypothetical protein